MATAALEKLTNSLERSLTLGFRLTEGELEQVVAVMRSVTVHIRDEVVIPPKMVTPSTKGLSIEEKRAVRAEVDAFNKARIGRVRTFMGRFLPDDTAALLADRIKPYVEGLVVLHCSTDQRYTLIIEHS